MSDEQKVQMPTGLNEVRKGVAEAQAAKMVADPTTGGMKGSKAERYDLVPAEPLRLLALHYGLNSEEHGGKYPARNWEKGYRWSLSFAAMMRHAWAFWRGEWFDRESPGGRTPHVIAVAWHAFALMEWGRTHPELDDRPGGPWYREAEKRAMTPEATRERLQALRDKLWAPCGNPACQLCYPQS